MNYIAEECKRKDDHRKSVPEADGDIDIEEKKWENICD